MDGGPGAMMDDDDDNGGLDKWRLLMADRDKACFCSSSWVGVPGVSVAASEVVVDADAGETRCSCSLSRWWSILSSGGLQRVRVDGQSLH